MCEVQGFLDLAPENDPPATNGAKCELDSLCCPNPHKVAKLRRVRRINDHQVENKRRLAALESQTFRAHRYEAGIGTSRDSSPARFVAARDNRQPRNGKWRTWRPKSDTYMEQPEATPCFHEVRLTAPRENEAPDDSVSVAEEIGMPAKFPSNRMPARYLKRGERILHQLYFLIEPYEADSEPLRLLERLGIIYRCMGADNKPVKCKESVEWTKIKTIGDKQPSGIECGRYYLNGYGITSDTTMFAYGDGIVISTETARQLFSLSRHNPRALAHLHALDLLEYTTAEGEMRVRRINPIQEMTGLRITQISPAIVRGCLAKRGGGIRRATILRRRDLNRVKRRRHIDKIKPNPKYLNRKKAYSRKSSRQTTLYRAPAVEAADSSKRVHVKQRRLEQRRRIVLAEHERYITDYRSLLRAAKYIYTGVAKSQSFIVLVDRLAEGVKIILGYVQSRYDRGLFLDLDASIKRTNPVVEGRLCKWERESGIAEPIDFVRVWRNVRRQAPTAHSTHERHEGHKPDETIVPVPVSRGYLRQPEHYITNESELLTAVRHVLNGAVIPQFFNVLDPRAAMILDYCIELRAVCIDEKGNYSGPRPIRIAQGQVPELRERLERAELLSFPTFSFEYL